jgi:hypothetical protein
VFAPGSVLVRVLVRMSVCNSSRSYRFGGPSAKLWAVYRPAWGRYTAHICTGARTGQQYSSRFSRCRTETGFGMIEDFITEETEKLVRTVLQELTVLGYDSPPALCSVLPQGTVSHAAWYSFRTARLSHRA